jgi:hypothetical protein
MLAIFPDVFLFNSIQFPNKSLLKLQIMQLKRHRVSHNDTILPNNLHKFIQ